MLVAAIYLVYRLSQRRFSNLDDGDMDIKWPELNPEGQEVSASTSTLNPLGTRRTGGAGVDMGDGDSEFPDEMSQRGGLASSGTSFHNRQPSYEQLAMADYGHSQAGYDPYLGASAAPFPPPANIYPPSQYAPTYYSNPYTDAGQSQEALSSAYSQGYAGAAGAVSSGTRSPPVDEFQHQDRSRRTSINSFHSNSGSYSDPFANYSTAARAASPKIASPQPGAGPAFEGIRRGVTPTQGPL